MTGPVGIVLPAHLVRLGSELRARKALVGRNKHEILKVLSPEEYEALRPPSREKIRVVLSSLRERMKKAAAAGKKHVDPSIRFR